MSATQTDKIWAYGAGLRAQWDSLELDARVYQELHNHVPVDGAYALTLSSTAAAGSRTRNVNDSVR